MLRPQLSVIDRGVGGDGGAKVDGVERHIACVIGLVTCDAWLVVQAVGGGGQRARHLEHEVLAQTPERMGGWEDGRK